MRRGAQVGPSSQFDIWSARAVNTEMMRSGAGLLLLFAIASEAIASGSHNPQLQIEPLRQMVDSPFHLKLSNFKPNHRVTVISEQADEKGRPWHAELQVTTDARGSATVRAPMRLITEMHPPAGLSDPYTPPLFPRPVNLAISAEGTATNVSRLQVAPGVRTTALSQPGLVGMLFEPAGAGKHRGIVVLGGSEGGFERDMPALLASHGYVVLSLAYFGAPGLGQALVRIPVERVLAGIDWLSSRSDLLSGGVYVTGQSRGGELALLAGIHSDKVRGIVAIVPTPIIFAGLEFGKGPVDQSPWTIAGAPVDYITFAIWQQYRGSSEERLVDHAILPLWKLRSPTLIIASGDDKLAMSAITSRIAIHEARKHGRVPVTLISYPDAGHLISRPFSPAANRSKMATPYGELDFGGTLQGYENADSNSWKRILAFLQR